MARPSVYAVDGSGRDSYIGGNNGGLYRQFRPASAMNIGSFSEKKRTHSNIPNMGMKRQVYHNNGTGRDSYVGRSDIGNYTPLTNAQLTRSFVGKLRHYGRSGDPSEIARPIATKQARAISKVGADKRNVDPYLHSQTYFFKNDSLRQSNSKMYRYQVEHDTFLSKPKRVAAKFSDFRRNPNVKTLEDSQRFTHSEIKPNRR